MSIHSLWSLTDKLEDSVWKEAQKYKSLAHPIRDCGLISGIPEEVKFQVGFPRTPIGFLGKEAFLTLFLGEKAKKVPLLAQCDAFLKGNGRVLVKGETTFIPQERELCFWLFPKIKFPCAEKVFGTVDAFIVGRHFLLEQKSAAGFYCLSAAISDLSQGLALPQSVWGFLINFSESVAFCDGVEEAALFFGVDTLSFESLKISNFPTAVVFLAVGVSRHSSNAPVNAHLREGMSLYLAGALGGAKANQYQPHIPYLKSQLSPQFRLSLFQKLTKEDKIKDISDGLKATLKSWLFTTDAVNLRVMKNKLAQCVAAPFPRTTFEEMWEGGDDYSLLIATFQDFSFDKRVVKIGEVLSGTGEIQLC